MSGLKAYVANRNPQYIKAPLVWLRGEHWDDEYNPVEQSSGGYDMEAIKLRAKEMADEEKQLKEQNR